MQELEERRRAEVDQPPLKCRLFGEIRGERQDLFRLEINEESFRDHERPFRLRAHALKQRATGRVIRQIGADELHAAARSLAGESSFFVKQDALEVDVDPAEILGEVESVWSGVESGREVQAR